MRDRAREKREKLLGRTRRPGRHDPLTGSASRHRPPGGRRPTAPRSPAPSKRGANACTACPEGWRSLPRRSGTTCGPCSRGTRTATTRSSGTVRGGRPAPRGVDARGLGGGDQPPARDGPRVPAEPHRRRAGHPGHVVRQPRGSREGSVRRAHQGRPRAGEGRWRPHRGVVGRRLAVDGTVLWVDPRKCEVARGVRLPVDVADGGRAEGRRLRTRRPAAAHPAAGLRAPTATGGGRASPAP